MSNMTMRERMLALVQGRPHDRVPFVQYSNNAGPDAEVQALLGRERIGLLAWTQLYALDAPNCTWRSEEVTLNGRKAYRFTLGTPEGDLVEERYHEPVYNSTAACTHYVREPEDYKPLMAWLRDIRVRKDLTALNQNLATLGDDGLPHSHVARTPYQQLWVQWVGIQDLAIHLCEYPGLMEEVFALLEDVQRRIFEVACEAVREAPVPYIVFPDNITAPMVGVDLFERHCAPAYNQLAAMLDETGRDIPVFVHMDGDLKPLHESIGRTRVRGLDSMSPPPDNDTSVALALATWPQMRVCINFPSSVHLREPDEVYAHTTRMLEEGGHSGRFQIQLSENVPPFAWRRSLPAIANAIDDFYAR